MIVANTGTARSKDVKLAGTAPTGWDVSFDPTTDRRGQARTRPRR